MNPQPNLKIICDARERFRSHRGSTIFSEILKTLADLETSFRASQSALLARDVGSLEDLTRQQSSLKSRILNRWEELSAIVIESAAHPGALQVSGLEPVQELSNAATRVLRLGQVHLALLERMQQLLRVAGNLAGESQVGYTTSLAWPANRADRIPGSSTEA